MEEKKSRALASACRLGLVALVAVVGLQLQGCGSDGGLQTSSEGAGAEPYVGPTSTIHISGGVDSSGRVVVYDESQGALTLKNNATDSSTATGDAGPMIGSITETADVTCAFSDADITGTNTEGVVASLVTNITDRSQCSDQNRCVLCKTTPSSGNCTLDCTGVVPSDGDTVSGTSLAIKLTLTSTFTSAMPEVSSTDKGGMIRLDADSSGWTEVNLTTTPIEGHTTIASSTCNGDFDETVDVDITSDLLTLFTAENLTGATSSTMGLEIKDADTTNCIIATELTATYDLSDTSYGNLSTSGGSYTDTSKTLTFHSTICDWQGDCPDGG